MRVGDEQATVPLAHHPLARILHDDRKARLVGRLPIPSNLDLFAPHSQEIAATFHVAAADIARRI